MPAARHTFAEAHALGEADGQARGLDSVGPRVRLEKSGAQCHRQQRLDRQRLSLGSSGQQRARIGVDAHRGRDERICLARLAVRRLGHMCAVRCIRWHRPDGQYGPVPARGSSFLCTYGFWTATNAHRGRRTSESIGIGFPLPLHDGLHLRRVCCLRWGECVKWFSTVQSQDPKEGALNREG
jgi:hypothetical protein